MCVCKASYHMLPSMSDRTCTYKRILYMISDFIGFHSSTVGALSMSYWNMVNADFQKETQPLPFSMANYKTRKKNVL